MLANLNKQGVRSALIKLVVRNTEQEKNSRLWNLINIEENAAIKKKRPQYERQRLQSYVSVCTHSGRSSDALYILAKSDVRVINIDHVNVILKSFVRESRPRQVDRTWTLISRRKIQPNAATYAIQLLWHSRKKSTVEVVQKTLDEMAEKGYNCKEIFQSTYFTEQEREAIRVMLKKVIPKYKDEFFKLPADYDCRILQDFDKAPSVNHSIWETSKKSKELSNLIQQQLDIEGRDFISIKSIANDELQPNTSRLYRNLWNDLAKMWRRDMYAALDEEIDRYKNDPGRIDRVNEYPYLCSVDRKILVDLMMNEIQGNDSSASFSMSTNSLHTKIGEKVMIRYLKARDKADGSLKERLKIYNDYMRNYYMNPSRATSINSRQYFQQRAAELKCYGLYKGLVQPDDRWPANVTRTVGRLLYSILLRCVKFDPSTLQHPDKEIDSKALVNAFYTAYYQIDGSYKIKEEFRLHPEFEKLRHICRGSTIQFEFSQLPSRCPPFPWLFPSVGGYLTTRSDMIRTSGSTFDRAATSINRVPNQQLYPTYDSLNTLSQCPWVVNQDILDLVISLFRKGGNPELSVPVDERNMKIEAPILKKDPTQADKMLYKREKIRFEKRRREMYSQWCDALYRLSIANNFRSRTLWFPHNLDFRGRTYPIPPHFNHLGSDLARSLLMFAKGQPLGEKGLDWLKIQVINLSGSMKRNSIEERLDHANSILDSHILDSADNPWNGYRWWMKQENPWQVLACCKEIAKAIRSGDGCSYVCHLPIHQDGSCNGLQHYAALGRDYDGAAAVNLVPSSRPQDVYSRVLEQLEASRSADVAKGDKVAKSLDGIVKRKVIKQTVMTVVYGVTHYGAREQIARQLRAKRFSDVDVSKASSYLTRKTFESIGSLFMKSMSIQAWLNRCAFIIASRYGRPVEWVTPLGLPIVQPYTRFDTPRAIELAALPDDSIQSNLDASKQKTAFPPNFVHSLDSCHMMLTSMYCQRAGITFVSVHDCFWTHASSVDEMNRICREQFIALHSEPLLMNLGEQFMKKYGRLRPLVRREADQTKPNSLVDELQEASSKADANNKLIFSQVPETGELDLNLIKDSVYFFS